MTSPKPAGPLDLSELKTRADICEVWVALGGGHLRGNRGQGFWRGGSGFNVALDARRGLWFDFASGAGGDVVALVQAARDCDFRAAVEWLADFAGLPARAGRHDVDTDWRVDCGWARWWGATAKMLAEAALAELSPCHANRRELTELLAVLRAGDGAVVDAYRAWRRCDPQLTSGMCWAGRRSDARMQRRLAHWMRRYCDGSQTTTA